MERATKSQGPRVHYTRARIPMLMFMCLKRVNIKNYLWQHVEGISKTDLPVVVPVTLDHDSIFCWFFSSFFVCLSYNKNDLELHKALLHTFHSFTYSGVCTVNRKQLGASGKDMF